MAPTPALVALLALVQPAALAGQVRAALETARPAEDRQGAWSAAAAFYQARDHQPAWTVAGLPTPQALELVEVLLAAGTRGLPPEAYGAAGLADQAATLWAASPAPADEAVAAFEVALTRAVLAYAADVGRGRLEPRALGLDWPERPPLALPELGEALAASSDPAGDLAALEPRWPGYQALLAALPAHPEAAERIAVTLERWRWLPPEADEPLVLVNVPAFRLEAWDAGAAAPSLRMPVVVGRTDDPLRQTPVMARPIANAVLAPHWEVPRRLARVDLWPRFEADPAMGPRLGYFLEGPGGVEPVTPDAAARWRAGELKLRQAPGPKNALGSALLLFPNQQDIYLHDSPDRALFERERRAYSSGCVRVADAPALTAWVLRGTAGWGEARLQAALRGRTTTWIQPARRTMVYLAYLTAEAAADGGLRLHEDLYGADARLAEALRALAPAAVGYQERGRPESRWTKSSSG